MTVCTVLRKRNVPVCWSWWTRHRKTRESPAGRDLPTLINVLQYVATAIYSYSTINIPMHHQHTKAVSPERSSRCIHDTRMACCRVFRHLPVRCSWVPCRSRAHRRRCASPCGAVAAGAFGFPDDASADANTKGPKQRTEDEIRRSKLRAKLFFGISMALAIPLFLFMSAMYPAVMLLDRYRRSAEHLANRLWAALSTLPFVGVKVILS